MHNIYLGNIGTSKFRWNIPYVFDYVDEDKFKEDNSYLSKVLVDGSTKPTKIMSFWWSSEPYSGDIIIHYHSYPDNGSECFNPEIIFEKEETYNYVESNTERINWLIDYMSKHVIGVDANVIYNRVQSNKKEIDRLQKNINKMMSEEKHFIYG